MVDVGAPPGSRCGTAPARYAPAALGPSVMHPRLAEHNCANIAASVLLTHPKLLSGAVLFRPMVPFRPQGSPDLKGIPILLAAARRDQIVPPEQTSELAEIFTSAGARVTIHWHPGGHELGSDDVAAAKEWLPS